MSDNSLTALRKQLLANGYQVLPNVDKACKVKHWNSDFLAKEAERYGSIEAAVETWPKRMPKARTTGIPVGGGLLVWDLDIDDPDLAAAIAGVVEDVVPEVFLRAPARYGSGQHKVALFSRLDGDLFIRHGSHKYSRPEDLAKWRAAVAAGSSPDKPGYHHVEVFGGKPAANGTCSRQFGAFGPHTVAADGTVKVEYTWADGGSLADVPFDQLPVATEAQVWAVIEGFEKAALDLGWEAWPDTGGSKGGEGQAVYDIDRGSTQFDVLGHGMLSYAEVEDLVLSGEPDVRCTAMFIPGEISVTRDRCQALWSDKYGCTMIMDWALNAWHLPADMKIEPGLADVADILERLKAESTTKPSVFERRIEPTDFYAYMVEHKYIHIPTRALWPAPSVNARLGKVGGVKASLWLDQNRFVEQMTWSPGDEMVIYDKVMAEGGWITHRGIRVFNLYRAPDRSRTTAGDISVWRNHLERIYPLDADDIERWLAHRVQKPAEKINHALVMGGRQGIGKDTLLEPLRYAVGSWNFGEVSPVQLMARFNGFLKSVVLRISEVRDRADTDRYAFYNHSKVIIAAPPDTLMIDEKNAREYRVPNVCGVIITLNEKPSLYLPADDRRHFVVWSEAAKEDFDAGYFRRIYQWYAAGGLAIVAQHLATLDLAGFDAKQPPRQTAAFREVVLLSQTNEDADMDEALDALGRPPAVVIDDLIAAAHRNVPFCVYLQNPANSRKLSRRFEEAGYVSTPNPDAKSGQWRLAQDRRRVVYTRRELGHAERMAAAGARAGWADNVLPFVKK